MAGSVGHYDTAYWRMPVPTFTKIIIKGDPPWFVQVFLWIRHWAFFRFSFSFQFHIPPGPQYSFSDESTVAR